MPIGEWLSTGLVGAIGTGIGYILKPLCHFMLSSSKARTEAEEKKRHDELEAEEKKRHAELEAEEKKRHDELEAEATARRVELEAENTRLKAVLDRLDNYYNDLREQVDTAASQIKVMQDNHMACEKALAAMTERLSGSERHAQGLTDQLKEAEGRIWRLENHSAVANPEALPCTGSSMPS